MKRFYNLLIIFLFAVGAFLRLYNFENRLIFGPEQSISLLTAAGNLTKFSLLGEVNVQRATSTGLNPFHGAYFNYLLIPALLLFNFRPLPISYVFAFLNLATALVFFFVVKKIFGKTNALFTIFYFLLSAKMIHHSLFIWNLNLLPLLGVLTLSLLYVQSKNRLKLSPPFWLGLIAGFGFGLQYLYLPFIFLTLFLTVWLSKRKLPALAVFFAGGILGNLSMVIFDLRHDFYHLRTLWQYATDVLAGRISGGIHYYDFMYLLPYLFIVYAFATHLLLKIFKPLCLLPMLLFLSINLSSPLFNLYRSTGMAPGLTLAKLEQAAATIAADQPPEKFNVATLWDFDTRAHPFRYLLKYYYKYTPQPYENYADIDALYVFAPADYDINRPAVWELKTYLPYQVKELPSPTSGYRLYKLTK